MQKLIKTNDNLIKVKFNQALLIFSKLSNLIQISIKYILN